MRMLNIQLLGEQIRACVMSLCSIQINCQLMTYLECVLLCWCCYYCKHRCAAALAHTQDCRYHIKKPNEKLLMHEKVSCNKQVEIGKLEICLRKSMETSINIFQAVFVIFPFIIRSGSQFMLSLTGCAWHTPAHPEYTPLEKCNVDCDKHATNVNFHFERGCSSQAWIHVV